MPRSGGKKSPTGIRRLPHVGVVALDCGLRSLHRIINLLHGIDDPDEASVMLVTVLELLNTYAWFHFQRIDRVMALADADHRSILAEERQAFLDMADTLKARVDGGANPEQAAEIRDVLCDWLFHHVLLFVMPLKPLIIDPDLADRVARQSSAPALLRHAGQEQLVDSRAGQAMPRLPGLAMDNRSRPPLRVVAAKRAPIPALRLADRSPPRPPGRLRSAAGADTCISGTVRDGARAAGV